MNRGLGSCWRRLLAAAEARAGLDARGARVVAGGRLLAAGAHHPDRDRAAVRGHHEPVAVDADDLPRRRAEVALDAVAVEDLDVLGADRRPRTGPRVRAADEVVDVGDRPRPVDLDVSLAAPAL